MVKTEAEQKHLDNLVNNCIAFADLHGEVLDKTGSHFLRQLPKEYKTEDLEIFFRVQGSRYSGSSYVKVTQHGTIVFEAESNFMEEAFNTNAKIYIKGKWEDKIPKWKQ